MKNNIDLFEKLLEADFVGEEDYELDEDLVNMLVAEARSVPNENQGTKVFVMNFIRAHLTTLYNGRRFGTDEYELLQELMQDNGDEVILGAYEFFSMNRNESELIETLGLLAKLEIDEVEIDYGSPIQESVQVQENKTSDYQRDSWPHGFQTMVDRSKALKILEEFKPLMSSVKYTILYGVIRFYIANRTRRTILYRSHFILLISSKGFGGI